MKKNKAFAAMYALMGAILAVGTIYISAASRNVLPAVLAQPEEAAICAEAFLDTVCAGDFAGAGERLYGSSQLVSDAEPENVASQRIWDAFAGSLRYTLLGEPYASENGMCQQVQLTGLDIPSVTEHLKDYAQELLTQKVAQAEDMDEVYDDGGSYREEFVMDILLEATEQALEQNAADRTWELTLGLKYENGQWWVVPDAELIRALSGGIQR